MGCLRILSENMNQSAAKMGMNGKCTFLKDRYPKWYLSTRVRSSSTFFELITRPQSPDQNLLIIYRTFSKESFILQIFLK